MKKTAVVSALSFIAGGILCSSVAVAGTNLVQAQKIPSRIVVNGKVYNNVPRLVYGGSSYAQLYAIQQGLKSAGFTATWDGTTFNIQTPKTGPTVVNDSNTTAHFSSPSLTQFTVDGQTIHLTLETVGKGTNGQLLVGYKFSSDSDYANLLELMLSGKQEDVRAAINNTYAADAANFASQNGYNGYGVGLYFEGDFSTYPTGFDVSGITYNSSTGTWHVSQCFSMTTAGSTGFNGNNGTWFGVMKSLKKVTY